MVTIEELKKANACGECIEWWREHPGDYELLAEEHPDWYLWGAGNIENWEKNSERLDRCAEHMPWEALQYASDKLTPERIDFCAEQEPWAAMRYVADKLTPERLDLCAQKEPWAALQYAPHLLTPERKEWCQEQIRTVL